MVTLAGVRHRWAPTIERAAFVDNYALHHCGTREMRKGSACPPHSRLKTIHDPRPLRFELENRYQPRVP